MIRNVKLLIFMKFYRSSFTEIKKINRLIMD